VKFIVDSLPYYGEECPFEQLELCYAAGTKDCPRTWDKYKVSSKDTTECMYLLEMKGTFD
jgi:hypothetical protein